MLAVQTNNKIKEVKSTKFHEILLDIGMPPNLLGYSYIVTSLELITSNPSYLSAITRGLYKDVADKYGTTSSSVERGIRHAISVAWQYGDLDYIDYIFHNCIRPDKGTPTNSLFLSRLFHYFNNVELD